MSEFGRCGGSGLDWTRAEGSALQLGGGGRCLRWGRLQLERGLLLLSEGRLGFSELVARSEGRLFNIGQVAVGRGGEAGRKSVLAECRGLGAKSGSVGSRLSSKLSEVQVGSGLVAEVHRLVESALGVVSVEDDAVKRDADDFDDNFDNDANEGPVLPGGVSLQCLGGREKKRKLLT